MILAFRCEGLLQGWGAVSKFDERYCDTTPTKSGIAGLLSAAFGYSNDDPRYLSMCSKFKMYVRIDRKGSRFIDYTTAKDYPIRTVDGKVRAKDSSTIVINRYYLTDASFVVYLESDDSFIKECYDALCNPVYAMFLGRKCCVPSSPLYPEIYNEDIVKAVYKYDMPDRHDSVINLEIEDSNGPKVRRDVLVGDRVFSTRRVRYAKIMNY